MDSQRALQQQQYWRRDCVLAGRPERQQLRHLDFPNGVSEARVSLCFVTVGFLDQWNSHVRAR